ncbi:MAG: hypothetical protein JOZ16_05435 [Methylobacteriaceae bacterium]|nr:hypothetical protein [Methylobacteriaceae bacterium]
MPKKIITAMLAFAALTCLAAAAHAQAPVTFAAGNGDDSHDCLTPNTACRNIFAAHDKTAAGGVIHALAGSYGGIIITKAIEIIADQGNSTIANTGFSDNNNQSAAINIKAGAGDIVRIRGITVDQMNGGSLVGISLNSGAALELENIAIVNAPGGGLHVIPNVGAAASIVVKDSFFGYNLAGNVLIAPKAGVVVNAVFDRVTTPSGAFGIKADNSDSGKIRADVRDSVANDNANNGYIAVGNGANPVHFMIERSTASGNGAYGAVASGAQAFMIATYSTLIGNATGLAQLAGSTVASTGTNTINFNTANKSGTITPIGLQ